MVQKRVIQNSEIDRKAISPYYNYCDGYSRPGQVGEGYVSVLTISTGEVEKVNDSVLDGIVAYDRAEKNEAYIGQINMITASSFCGLAGRLWGYDIVTDDGIENNKQEPILKLEDPDFPNSFPIYDAKPLLEAGKKLFGSEKTRYYPPVPGAHVICANKSVTAARPKSGQLHEGQAYGVWCYIAVAITQDRNNSADLFIEDAGLWTKNDNEQDLQEFLEKHKKLVAWSILNCGKDQGVQYKEAFIGATYRMMTPGNVGTALTCVPYITLAKNAVPSEGFEQLEKMTLSDWEKSQKAEK